jgi:nitrogen regulatory protein PII
MKRIEAIVPSSSIWQTIGALEDLNVHFTHYDSRYRGKPEYSPEVEYGRGTTTMREQFETNVTIVAVVTDSMVDKVVEKILKSTSLGAQDEGKIFVYEVKDAIDMRSEAHGDSAI